MTMPHALHILIIGAGAREHALAWKLAQSSRVGRISVAPGNGGTSFDKTRSVDISADDFPALVRFAVDNDVRG